MLAAPFVVLAALAALFVLLLVDAHDRDSRDTARAAALEAARQEAVNLTTISFTSAAHDLDRIITGATGKLRSQFESERAQFPAVLARERSRSAGRVLAAAVVSCSPSAGTAQVVVATDATVRTQAAGGPRTVLKHYRMVMRLQKTGDRWLVGDVAFAGVPQ